MGYDENWNYIPDNTMAGFQTNPFGPTYNTLGTGTFLDHSNIDNSLDFMLNNQNSGSFMNDLWGPSSDLGGVNWSNLFDSQGTQDFYTDLGNTDGMFLNNLLSGLGNVGSSILSGMRSAAQPGSGLTGSQSAAGNILSGLGGLYGAYAQNQLADKQSELAKYVLQNGDPYRDYRKNTEIPFMGEMLNRGKTEMGQTDTAFNNASAALNKPLQSLKTITDPTLDKTKYNPTLGTNLYNTSLDQTKYNPNISTSMFGLNDPTVNALKSKLTSTNALGGDYGYYQNKLHQSYDNPLGVYNSPEMKALNDVFRQEIERRDSAAGRNSQYGARAVEMQNNFLKNLDQYRGTLGGLASTSGQMQEQDLGNTISGLGTAGNIALSNNQNLINNQAQNNNALLGQQQNNITQQSQLNNARLSQQQNNLTGQNQINSSLLGQQQNNIGQQNNLNTALLQLMQNQNYVNNNINSANANQINWGNSLSNLFGTQGNYALNTAKLGVPSSATAGAGTQQFGNIMSGANALGTTSYNNLLQGLGNIFGSNG